MCVEHGLFPATLWHASARREPFGLAWNDAAMSDVGGSATVRRRLVLGAAVGVALAGAGCGIRLEEGAPAVPLVPTRDPIAGEAAVVALLRGTEALVDDAAHTPPGDSPLVAALPWVHRRQAAVLRGVLEDAGVPPSVINGPRPDTSSETPSPSGTPSPTPAPLTPTLLGTREAEAITSLPALLEAPPAMRPLLVALLAQRASTATVLAGTPPSGLARTPTDDTPNEPWPDPRAAATLLDASRAAAYGFEVVAAQSRDAARSAAWTALTTIRGIAGEQERRAGTAARPPAVGYPLPFPVRSAADATRLATHVSTGLLESYAAQLPTVTANASARTTTSVTDLLRWLAAVQVDALAWKVSMAPFPGLS